MDPLKVLVLLVLGNSLTHAFFRKITRVVRRPCSWKVCKGHEWKNDWSPTSIPQGKCITQNRKAHHSYTELKGNLICPPTVPCANLDQKRSICKYFTVYTFVFRNYPLLQHKIDINVSLVLWANFKKIVKRGIFPDGEFFVKTKIHNSYSLN